MTSPTPVARRDLRAAWWSLLLVVPCFLLSFLVGEGIISLLGYEVGGAETPSFWAAALAAMPALLVFASRARREGAHHVLLPFGIAAALSCAFLLLNTFPLGH